MFDLFAIAAKPELWHDLLMAMFDVKAWYCNIEWGGFIALGGAAFMQGISLLIKRKIERI